MTKNADAPTPETERITLALSPGTVERLRSLAGGQRKVGAFLSDVVTWLWSYRDALSGAPLQDFAPVLREWIPRIVVSPEEQNAAKDNVDQLRSQLDELEERLRRLDENINTLESRKNAGATMDAVKERPQ